MNGINVLSKETPHSAPFPFLPCEDATRSLQSRRGPSPDHAGTLTSDSRSPELRAINFRCSYAILSVVLCYSSWNRLRQYERVF